MDDSTASLRPIPPVVWGEICLTFPQDFPMEEIDRTIGICATEKQRKSRQRISPLTGQQNPGFWSYQIPAAKAADFDCAPALQRISDFLSAHFSALQTVLETYPGAELTVFLYIQVKAHDDNPGIRLTPDFMELLHCLPASLEIHQENDFSASLSPILDSFFHWLGLTPEEYARREDDMEEYMFPQWDVLISAAKAVIAQESTEFADELWTAIALDNEQEILLDTLSDQASDRYLDCLILSVPAHPQFNARWQAAELIRRRPTPNGLSVLQLLCRDEHPYVAKRARNSKEYLEENAAI